MGWLGVKGILLIWFENWVRKKSASTESGERADSFFACWICLGGLFGVRIEDRFAPGAGSANTGGTRGTSVPPLKRAVALWLSPPERVCVPTNQDSTPP